MSETALPKEIEHLDFPTYQPVRYVRITPKVEESKEPQKTCRLMRKHPFDDEGMLCGRKAYVLIDLDKPCGRTNRNLPICKGCWTEAQEIKDKNWVCAPRDIPPCLETFLVADVLVGWKLIK